MRLTRAAQRAQQDVEEPMAATSDLTDRAPLNDISPNASPEHVVTAETDLPKKTPKRSKSKKGAKKGAKGKKGKAADDEDVPVVLEDERQAAGTPASEAAVEELAQAPLNDTVQEPISDERPPSPPAKAVRLTRRQLAKQEEELKQSQRAQSPPREAEPASESVEQVPTAETPREETIMNKEEDTVSAAQEVVEVVETLETSNEPTKGVIVDEEEPTTTLIPIVTAEDTEHEVAKPIITDVDIIATIEETEPPTPSVEVTEAPEPKTLASEKPRDEPASPIMSRTPSRRASRSPSKSPMRIEESFEAIDALEEALEDVGKAVSHFDSSCDERSPRKKAAPRTAATPNTRSKTPGKTPSKTPLASRVSRTPSAAPKSIKPTKTSLARSTSVRVAPTKDTRNLSTDTGDYLASKRRPISVSFPTPPPPPKGRAPTKPTFQLSSDAVAAKLKAQKEERLKREAERGVEGPVVRQRPVSVNYGVPAKSAKPPTKPSFQLPGEAIAAKLKAQKEERLKREAESGGTPPKARPASFCMPPPAVKSTKPPTKASFQLPGEAVAAKLKAAREERQKREEEAEAAKKEATRARPAPIRKPVAPGPRALPGVSIPPPSKSGTQAPLPLRTSSLTLKRNSVQAPRSTSVSTTSSNRNSMLLAKSTVTPVDAAQQKLKGKEVFQRDRMEKDVRERERREKEEAAKKARAEAAERGRIASREWAEKQRKKMMEAVRMKAGPA